MNSFRLALRVLRVDRRTRTSAILTGVGVAVATALVLLLVSLPFATQERGQRAQWQQPSAPSGAALSLASSDDSIGAEQLTRVDVAALGDPSTVRLPSGVPHLPEPGQVLVSPTLAQQMRDLPAAELADRFGGQVVGQLQDSALSHPGQLAALVGHEPTAMPMTAKHVAGFAGGGAGADPMLQLLAGVGVVVLLVPSLVLVASASRLTAARRERRLAAFRLAGASPRQIIGMVTAETAIAALAGALLGWASSPFTHRLATLVPWDGGTWQASDFTLPPALTVLLVLVIPLLVVLAGVLGLRRVVRAPLGAAGAHAGKHVHWWRVLAVPAAGLVFALAISSGSELAVVVSSLAALIASAMVVGPWVTSMVGRLFVWRWRKASGLLAGRRLAGDPKGAYRASAGVVLAVFAGSMALTLMPSFETLADDGGKYADSVQHVRVDAKHAPDVLARTNATLADNGVPERALAIDEVLLSNEHGGSQAALVVDCGQSAELLRVRLPQGCADSPGVYSTLPVTPDGLRVRASVDGPAVGLPADTGIHQLESTSSSGRAQLVLDRALLPSDFPGEDVTVAISAAPGHENTVRTALVAATDGGEVSNAVLERQDQQAELADLRRVTVIGLLMAAVLAGCSAAISTAGSVLDRRRTFGALLAAGTPVRVLARALRTEAALPALVATVGAGAVGVFVGMGLFSLTTSAGVVFSPWILAPIALGAGVAILAASVCGPALRKVQAEPLAEE